MKSNIRTIIASIALIVCLADAAILGSNMISRDSNDERFVLEELEQERQGISGSALYVIYPESSTVDVSINMPNLCIMKNTYVQTEPVNTYDKGAVIFTDLFNEGGEAYVSKGLDSFNYQNDNTGATCLGISQSEIPCLIPLEQFLFENGLSDLITEDGFYTDDELRNIAVHMNIVKTSNEEKTI